MSYATEIKKVELMPFAELYEVTSGNRVFRYTSYSKSFEFQGFTYIPAVIQKTTPSEDEQFKPTRISIKFPIVDPVNQYIANTPIEPTLTKITRVFVHDLTAYSILFSGEVLGTTLVEAGDQGIAICDFESDTIYLRNKIPRDIFQAYCNNTLFKASETGRPNCNLDKALFETTAVITISGNTLSSASFSAKPDGWFTGGYVETDYGDIRYITNHIGATVTLNVAFDQRLVSGASILAYPGDDKSPVTCRDKFNNFENFRGFPYIPSNNSTVWGVK